MEFAIILQIFAENPEQVATTIEMFLVYHKCFIGDQLLKMKALRRYAGNSYNMKSVNSKLISMEMCFVCSRSFFAHSK